MQQPPPPPTAVPLPRFATEDRRETRIAARRRLAAAFRDAGIDSPDVDARLLVCAAAGIDHAALIRDPDLLVTPEQAATLATFAARRLTREPVSRILGRREFWGRAFAVTPAVLDPRPETEGLVASVLDAVGGRRAAPLAILDLGTGSGAILAALLLELPAAHGIGVDLSFAACHVAHANLVSLGLIKRAAVVCGRWTEAVAARFDVVVSNPPYIATGEIATLERDVRAYDPAQALNGGPDGLDAYRAIVLHLAPLLRPGGVAAFECGAGQGQAVAGLMRAAGFPGTSVYLDLAGHDRIVVGALA